MTKHTKNEWRIKNTSEVSRKYLQEKGESLTKLKERLYSFLSDCKMVHAVCLITCFDEFLVLYFSFNYSIVCEFNFR